MFMQKKFFLLADYNLSSSLPSPFPKRKEKRMEKRPLSIVSPIPTAAHADLKMEKYGKEKGREEDYVPLVRHRTITKGSLFPSLFLPAPLHHLKCPVFKHWEWFGKEKGKRRLQHNLLVSHDFLLDIELFLIRNSTFPAR